NTRPRVLGTWASLSGVDRINLVGAHFGGQRVGKIQRAPLPRTDIVAVGPITQRMRVCVPNDVKGFVFVDSPRNFGASDTAGHLDGGKRRLPRAWTDDRPRRGQRRVAGRRVQIAVEGN